MSDKPTKRKREVERIEDWEEARYSIVPPRAALDARLKDPHWRMLTLIGKVNTQQGWCQLSQKDAAELFGLNRQTVNAAVSDLVEWNYVERKTQAETRTSFCHYRVLIDEPEPAEGVSPADDTPQGEGVSATDDTCVGSRDDTGVASETTPPIYKEHAREIRDQRSLPPKSPNGGPSGNPVDWKCAALEQLRSAGRNLDAVDGLIAPLLSADKRLSLGNKSERAVALAELAAAAHGLPRPAMQAAVERLLALKEKLTTRLIRNAIDHARRGGAMVVVRKGTPQWARWLAHLEKVDPRQAQTMARFDVWQVPSEWPSTAGKDAA